ncbi:MAG: CCA tRNA nucleotidyltransferase [Bacteroidota bacterium]
MILRNGPYDAFLTHRVFGILRDIAGEEDREIAVIGGYVRDLLLGNDPSLAKDIDIVTTGSGIELAKKVQKRLGGKAPLSVFKNYGTAMLRCGELDVEFVGARKESYRADSRKPAVENGSLEDDQRRRDFTINALALSLHPDRFARLSDPFNGLSDLEKGIIRTPLDPHLTFSDDPLRMLRGIRFATRLGFTLSPETQKGMKEKRDRIRIVSQERITDELNKIIMTPRPSEGFLLLDKTGLLELILPELHAMKGIEKKDGIAHKDNFLHTIEVLDNVCKNSDNLWLRWSALLHDVAKPVTRRFEPGNGWTFHAHEFIGAKMIPGLFKRMKLPLGDPMKYVQKMVLLHLRPIVLSQDVVTDSAIRRLLFDAGDELDELMTLCEADITSKNEKTVRKHLDNFALVREKLRELEERDHIRNFQPPVTGDDIQHIFGIPPCREIGIIKTAIKDAILDGIIPNDYDAALDLTLQKAAELGLKPVNLPGKH